MDESEYFKKRSDAFQKNIELAEFKNSHNKFAVNLRKAKRIEVFKKKRFEQTTIDESNSFTEEILYVGLPSETMLQYFPDIMDINTEIEKLRYYSNILRSTNIPDFIILEILMMFRMSLSTNDKHMSIYVNEGLIPVIFSYISSEFSHGISSEAM